jgi:hypothetical protein
MSGAKPRGAIAKKRKSPWLEARAEKFRKNKKWSVPEKFNLDSCGVRPVLRDGETDHDLFDRVSEWFDARWDLTIILRPELVGL